jgi:hypothetical protein
MRNVRDTENAIDDIQRLSELSEQINGLKGSSRLLLDSSQRISAEVDALARELADLWRVAPKKLIR